MDPQDSPSRRGNAPERPGPFAVTGLLVAIAATIAALVLIDNSRRFSGGLLIFAGVALVVVWIFTTVSESPRYRNGIVALFAIVLVGSGAYVLIHGGKPSTGATKQHGIVERKGAVIRLSDPKVTTQDPLPVVRCQYNVEVVGHLPTGDMIAIGNGLQSSGYVAFVADATPVAPGQWRAHIYVGEQEDAGKLFNLYVMTMPSTWADYLKSLSYWNGSGPPPSPAQLQSRETVKRSRSTTGCPRRGG